MVGTGEVGDREMKDRLKKLVSKDRLMILISPGPNTPKPNTNPGFIELQ